VGVVASCVGLAVVIAGWPDRHEDKPLELQAVSTTAVAVSTTAPATTVPSSAPPATTGAAPARPPANVHVIAFNASAVPGSAGRVSTRLKAQGYSVGSAGPDRKPARETSAVMYRPGSEAEAKAVAIGLGLEAAAVQAAEAATSGWGNAEVAIVIGNDLAHRV
jgi:hypothetical protein